MMECCESSQLNGKDMIMRTWSYMKCKRRAVGAYVMANIKNQDVREKWGSWRSLSDERRLSREY